MMPIVLPNLMRSPNRPWRSHSLIGVLRQHRWLLSILFFVLYTVFGHTRQCLKCPIPPISVHPDEIISVLPDKISCPSDEPPTWERLKKWEDDLPQHNLDLPLPEGRHGRYVLFKNQIQQLGWNNQLNEVLMNTWLAYKSNRAYVFQDYIWKREYYPWQSYINRTWPSVPHTPANALIAGPSVGGPWPRGDGAPRSVSEKWFDVVCPKEERRIINSEEVKPAIRWENGDVIFNRWQQLLRDAPERCIEVQGASRDIDNFPQTFDLFLWGSDRILTLWEDFKNSPVSQLLATSPVVESAISKNEYLFQSRDHSLPPEAPLNVYDRMLAIHLRRGDFQQACLDLANWNSTFYSWNLHPSLPDKFVNPQGYTWGKNTPENVEFYLKRCYPTDEAILEKIERSKFDYVQSAKPGETRYLDTLYILTNDKTGWVNSMIPFLRAHGWHIVVTTQDLDLDQEQKDVGMAVDMEYARKAAVFIGNGWSSFTSNIVHRRFVDGKTPISSRFY